MTKLKSRFPVYAWLLRLYPAAYRHEYERELLQTTADMLDDAPTTLAKLGIWSRIACDLPFNIARQNLEYIGGNMHHDMPHYVKRNSLLSGLLLLPFFVAIAANSIDSLVHNAHLYNSWLWRSPAIVLWVFYLPAMAFIISLVTYSLFVFKDAPKNKAWFKRALDLMHSWPVLIVGIIALSILTFAEFHDSSQCIVQSPVHAVTHASQTLNCIAANRATIPR